MQMRYLLNSGPFGILCQPEWAKFTTGMDFTVRIDPKTKMAVEDLTKVANMVEQGYANETGVLADLTHLVLHLQGFPKQIVARGFYQFAVPLRHRAQVMDELQAMAAMAGTVESKSKYRGRWGTPEKRSVMPQPQLGTRVSDNAPPEGYGFVSGDLYLPPQHVMMFLRKAFDKHGYRDEEKQLKALQMLETGFTYTHRRDQ